MMKSVLTAGALFAVLGAGAVANPTSANAAELGVTIAGNNGYVRVSTRSGDEDMRRRRANRVIDQNRGARSGDRAYRANNVRRPAIVAKVAPRRIVRPNQRHAYAPVRRHYSRPHTVYIAPRHAYISRPAYIPRPVYIAPRVIVRPAPVYPTVCLGRHELRLSLRDRGWFDIHNFDYHRGVVAVTASNRNGIFRIRLDDCTGRIIHRRYVANHY